MSLDYKKNDIPDFLKQKIKDLWSLSDIIPKNYICSDNLEGMTLKDSIRS